MPELKRLIMTRIVAMPEALDGASWPEDRKLFRVASDELLIYPAVMETAVSDPYAIIISDGSFAAVTFPEEDALHFLTRQCEWELPTERPAFAQGAVGGIATKLLFEEDTVTFIIPAAMAAEFETRMKDEG